MCPSPQKTAFELFPSYPFEKLKTYVEAIEFTEGVVEIGKMGKYSQFMSEIFFPQIDLVLLGDQTPEQALKTIVDRTDRLLSSE